MNFIDLKDLRGEIISVNANNINYMGKSPKTGKDGPYEVNTVLYFEKSNLQVRESTEEIKILCK